VTIQERVAAQCDPQAYKLYQKIQSTTVPREYRLLWEELQPILQRDYPSFAAIVLKVKPRGGGFVQPFVFNSGQRYVWNVMVKTEASEKPMYFVILKARQGGGISTFCCGFQYWQDWRQRYMQSTCIAHQMKTAEHMIETMRVFYDNTPEIIRPQLRAGNRSGSIPRSEMYFQDRNCWHTIQVASNCDPRGTQFTHVHETETAMYPDLKELNGALLPQLPTIGTEAGRRSSFIMESTPKGENDFYWQWQEALKPESIWTPIMLEWFLLDDEFSMKAPADWRMSESDKKLQRAYSRVRMQKQQLPVTKNQMWWRRRQIEDMYSGDEQYFDQEYPSDDVDCFQLQTKSVYGQHMRYIRDCVHEAEEKAIAAWAKIGLDVKGPIKCRLNFKHRERYSDRIELARWDPNIRGNWTVWAPPIRGHRYVIPGDPAEGLQQSDPTAAQIWDVDGGWQVGEMQAKMAPEDFADELDAVGRLYNMALLVPEINTIGFVVLSRLASVLTYPNLYKWPKWDEAAKFTGKRGWVTAAWNKGIMVSSSISALDKKKLRPSSRQLMSEMSTFYQFEGEQHDKFEAQQGYTDDLVICYCMAVMGIMQTPELALLMAADVEVQDPADIMLKDSRDPSPGQISKHFQDRFIMFDPAQGKVVWAEKNNDTPYLEEGIRDWSGMGDGFDVA
jgi:hypothetical protein